jgi:hypothetical protein
MAIIINEFELIPPPPERRPEQRPAAPSAEAEQPSQGLRPADVERILRRQQLRRLRIHAD